MARNRHWKEKFMFDPSRAYVWLRAGVKFGDPERSSVRGEEVPKDLFTDHRLAMMYRIEWIGLAPGRARVHTNPRKMRRKKKDKKS